MIHAISGDREFIQLIDKSRFNGFVHSIFEKVLNIQCIENGDLYTVANCKLDNGPNTLVTDITSFIKLKIAVNDKVFVRDKTLYIEDKIAISTVNVKKWDSILPIYPRDVGKLEMNMTCIKDYLAIHGKCGGMKKGLVPKNPFEAEMSRMLMERSSRLVADGLLGNSLPTAVFQATELVGLGPGLTPSGDDFLVGLFAVFNVPNSPCWVWKEFCTQVAARAIGLTNDISYMTLKKASIGKVRQSILCLLYSSLYGNKEDVIACLNEVLNIGSSSGTDITVGILCGWELNLKIGGNVCQSKWL